MILAKLINTVWATKKAENLSGLKLMLAEELTDSEIKKRYVVVDTIGAGIGDRVIITTGSSAKKMLGKDDIPIDAIIVGIIDDDCKI